nr:reverse transcriptase domain-containing protein [Tanacetum cinerariifolium]
MDTVRRDKQKEVHARLDFGEGSREKRTSEGSHYSSARTLSARPERLKVRDRLRYNDRHVLDRLGHRRQSAFDRLSETYSPSTTKSRPDRTSFRDRSRGRSRPHRRDAFNGDRPENRSRHTKRGRDSESPLSSVSKSDSSDGGHWKSKSKRHKPTDEDDLTMPWMCEEVDPFTPRICNFKSSRTTRMPNNVKTYNGTGDLEDHVKNFQAAAQVERWAMPTWCHMFNSTLIGVARVWFDELPPESIDSYKDLKAAFLAYFMQQKKEQFKVETRRMKGAPECMRIFGFMHGFNNPKLIKRLNEHVLKTMEEMMITTTAFIREEAAAASKKKGHTSWRTQDQSKRQTLEKRSDFRGQPKEGRGSSRFTPLTRTPKEILMVEAGKFPPPPAMVNPVEKRCSNKFCDFHNDKGHNTDECMQLKKQIEEEITFPSLATSSGTKGPLVIEAEIGRHMIHRMNVDGGSSMEVLYEYWFNRLLPEVKNQMVPASTSLTGFSGETIWPLGQLNLLEVVIGGTLSTKGRTELCSLLKKNLDIFAWQPSDMTGVPRSVAEHWLNIQEFTRSIKEKESGLETRQGHLSRGTKISRGRDHERGLLPQLVVQSSHGKKVRWQMANIQMAESDEEKTAFHTGQGVYCYTKLPFGLKNAGVTYQRLVDNAFDSQIGWNIEVYVDNLVIKSHTEAEMLRDIGEMFRPGTELYFNGKASYITSFRSQEASESVMLGEHNITYRPRTSVKGQVLADFLAEMLDESPPDASVVETQQEPWTLFTDRMSCVDGSGVGLILTSPMGT